MLIGKLAQASGFSRDTIRYYEKLGLIRTDNFDRQSNNYKNYPPQILDRLRQISQLKELGFTLTEIAGLFQSFGSESQPCINLPAQLDEKIALFDKKMALLEQYKRKLLAVRQICNGSCSSGPSLPECFASQCC